MKEKFIIEDSKDGYKIIKINKCDKKIYLGSKYNEQREIEKVINLAKPMREKDNYIVLGLGSGNHIKELLNKKHSNSKIMVVECEENLVGFLQENLNDSNFLLNEDVYICSTKQDIINFMDNYIAELNIDYLKIIPYANYNKIYKEELLENYKCIRDYIEGVYVNIHTKLKYSEVWFEARMKNLKYICESDTVAQYKDRHVGRPAIIVSAGPSLSKNIDLLKECKDFVIISGGRTIKSLYNIDISPDYTVIVDPSDKSYELVNGYLDKIDTNLIYNIGIPHEILKEHNNNKIIYSTEEILEEIMERKVGHLNVGGSVAHSMTEFAAMMGCDPIVFIGQDLAYTDDKGHATVASSPWESVDIENYQQEDDFLVKSIDGGLVRTSFMLNRFRVQMEKIIESHKNIKFINATEGGADILGTEVKTLKQVIREYGNKDQTQVNKNRNIVDLNLVNTLECKFINSKNAIEKSIKLYEKGYSALKKYEKSIKFGMKNINELNNKISIIDSQLLELSEEIIFMEEILFPTVYEVNKDLDLVINVEDNHKESVLKAIKTNIKLYEKVKIELERTLPLIEESIARLAEYKKSVEE